MNGEASSSSEGRAASGQRFDDRRDGGWLGISRRRLRRVDVARGNRLARAVVLAAERIRLEVGRGVGEGGGRVRRHRLLARRRGRLREAFAKAALLRFLLLSNLLSDALRRNQNNSKLFIYIQVAFLSCF